MQRTARKVGRRALITGTALAAAATAVRAAAQTAPADTPTTLADVPPSTSATITVERRGEIALIGLNRPFIQNRLDPPTRVRLAETLYQYEHDPTLRAAVLFGHGDNFSRGIDVDASQAAIIAGRRTLRDRRRRSARQNVAAPDQTDRGRSVHGDTWNLGHELYLAGDIRIAAADTRFGQDENTHGRFPGGGATIRFVREAGWGNAMRYMLTGDHWSAEESLRMGVTQQIAPTREAALEMAIAIARKIAACAPLSIKATLRSAHQVIDPIEADALSKLDAEYRRALSHRGFRRGPARRSRRPAAEISGEVVVMRSDTVHRRRAFLTQLPIGFAGLLSACRARAVDDRALAATGSAAPPATSREPSIGRAARPAPLIRELPANAPTLRWVPKHEDLVYTFGGAAPRQRMPGNAHRVVDGGLLRRRREDGGRSAVEGDARRPRQSADRSVLHRRRGARRHGRRAHPQARAGARLRRVVVRAGLRRARRHRPDGDARPRFSGDDVALRCRRGARTSRARRRATASTPGKCRSRRSSAASASRPRAAKCGRRSCPAPSAATWTVPRCAPATRCSSASTCRARCSRSATATTRWATARSWARRSKAR